MELCKINIALMSAFSAAAGFVLSTLQMKVQIIPMITGVFVLACGACALNQYQDRQIDARMSRTCNRPIPSGRINARSARNFSVLLICSGLLLLLLRESPPVFGLGMMAVLWYNGLYPFLKRKTAFAVIPGALIGVIPVAIGWVSGGGSLNDHALLPLCFFFFMWQVPHFWLILFSHTADYKQTDIPALVKIFNREQLRRVVFVWMTAVAVSIFLIPLFGIMLSDIAICLLGVSAAWIFWRAKQDLQGIDLRTTCSNAFKHMNMNTLFVMFVLIADKLL